MVVWCLFGVCFVFSYTLTQLRCSCDCMALLQTVHIIDLLVVKVPSAGSPRILPDIGDTTTV